MSPLLRAWCAAILVVGGSATAFSEEPDGPTVVERVNPEYPSAGSMIGAQAICLITFDVLKNGKTQNVCASCVVGAPPQQFPNSVEVARKEFVRTSEEAVSAWLFEPSNGGGEGVAFTKRRTELIYAFGSEDDGRFPKPNREDLVDECGAVGIS